MDLAIHGRFGSGYSAYSYEKSVCSNSKLDLATSGGAVDILRHSTGVRHCKLQLDVVKLQCLTPFLFLKFIAQHQTRRFKVDNTLHATNFDTGDGDVQLAVTEIDGRYPEKGRLTNSRCKELIYVLGGQGFVEVEGTRVDLNSGDVIHIDALKLIAICAPPWTSEQHLFID